MKTFPGQLTYAILFLLLTNDVKLMQINEDVNNVITNLPYSLGNEKNYPIL